LLELPEEHELIGFFESEPDLLDTDVKPWIYNEVRFTTCVKIQLVSNLSKWKEVNGKK